MILFNVVGLDLEYSWTLSHESCDRKEFLMRKSCQKFRRHAEKIHIIKNSKFQNAKAVNWRTKILFGLKVLSCHPICLCNTIYNVYF